MKISLNWLRKFIDLTESPNEIAAILTGCGLEVEKTEPFESVKGGLQGVVVGKVVSCEKHPGADKLKKTTVDIGSGVVPIVCGAPNVATGQHVLVATVGTTLYNKLGETIKINKAKIRGEVSEGMICAEDELGLGTSHEGIMVIETHLASGTPAADYFQLVTDTIFEIGLTPNRADAASHLGVARDLSAVLERPLKPFPPLSLAFTAASDFEVVVKNPDACPRYSYLLLEGVTVQPSPRWLQTALLSVGAAPINNIVDVTNYILYHLGQPLHAFDADKFTTRKVCIQTLPEGSPLVTLDGVARKLAASDLAICDADAPLCIAGVLGGKDSGITSTTTKIFIESAYFNPASIRKTSIRHGIKTEASFRFERGTDPAITLTALQQAAQLMLELAGGRVISPLGDLGSGYTTHFNLNVSVARIRKIIGQAIPKEKIQSILHALDIHFQQKEDGLLSLQVPSYRVDVRREIDVAEEVLRIFGYNNIELATKAASPFVASPAVPDWEKLQQTVSSTLVPLGFFEVITNSLSRSALATDHIPGHGKIKVLNALSESHDTLRQGLLNSSLEVISYNLNRQQKSLKIFEFGKSYHQVDGKYIEKNLLGLAITGNEVPENWQQSSRLVSLYTLKQYALTVLSRLGIASLKMDVVAMDAYKESIQISVGTKGLMILGEVHPAKLKLADVRQPVFYAEIDKDLVAKLYRSDLVVQEISKYPEVRRDLSLVIDQKITFNDISELAMKTERKLLQNINVFDVYAGEKLKPGYKAYSVSFILQDKQQTLTDHMIDQTMSRLMATFERELQAEIRR